jgi:predicted F0F1-ATPase subunit
MDENKNQKKARLKGIGLTTLGWEIALPIFGGVILGFYLDRWLNTTYMFTLSLLGLGIMIGYYNIYKRIEVEMMRNKLSNDQKNKDEQEE